MVYLQRLVTLKVPLRFYILLLFTLAVQLPVMSAVFTAADCKALSSSSYCQCSKEPARFEIECASSKSNGKFNLHIGPGKKVKLECDDIEVDEYQILPPLNIGHSKIVQIQHCPLPEHKPIAELLAHLGVQRVNYLTFAIDERSSNITRQHLSGLEHLLQLKLSSKALLPLPVNLFQDLNNLIWLDLRSNNFTLNERFFEALTNLTFLDLGHNFLERLPEGVFENQEKLQQLNLWSNRLRKLTKAAFLGAGTLFVLDLSSNDLVRLDADVFALLGELRSLDLSRNQIIELPAGLFAHNKYLTEFRLMNNRVPLKSLPTGLLGNLPFLEEVRLSCGLEHVPVDLFANSTKLINLTMRDNVLSTLPGDFFKDQNNLYELDLSNNQFERLPDELFENTANLVELKLSHNQLNEISSHLFSTLAKLEHLQLDNNNLASISFNAFRDTGNLKFLNLHNNQLGFADANGYVNDSTSPFRFLFKLQVLNLRKNAIMYLHKDWRKQLLNLRKLDLSFNSIRAFADDDLLFLSKNAIVVNLTHNLIEEINFNNINSMDFFNSAASILFDLNDNPLYCDCMLLHFLRFVLGEWKHKVRHRIEISTNNLRCEGPPALKEKEVIDLSYMELVCPLDDQFAEEKLCPHACECLVRPFDLMLLMNCSHGNMTHLPPLPQVSILRGIEINVEHNQLAQLPLNTTPGYADVLALHAAHNQLRHIEVANLPPNLEYLDVRHNRLQHLNASLLSYLNSSASLQAVFFAHNPWICDCEAKPLVEFMCSRAIRQKLADQDFRHMRCAVKSATTTNDSLKFTAFATSKLCPNERSFFIVIVLTLTLIVLKIGICAMLYQKYKKEIRLYLRQLNICCRVPIEEGAYFKYDAFVAYAHLDEHTIAEQLLPELETGPLQFRLCLQRRDWIVGECLTQQIIRSVRESQRTIVVLSQNFVKTWCDLEFRVALKSALALMHNRLIVVVYSDIDSIEHLDAELQACLKTSTPPIKWCDPYFWNKLRDALPQKTCMERLERDMCQLQMVDA